MIEAKKAEIDLHLARCRNARHLVAKIGQDMDPRLAEFTSCTCFLVLTSLHERAVQHRTISNRDLAPAAYLC